MMRRTVTNALFILCAMTPALMATPQSQGEQIAPTSAPAQKPASKSAPKVVTIVGCVEGTGAVGNPFTLSDAQDGIAYRLTGTNMRKFVGQRVQIAGGPDSRRVKIVGGLYPSPNVAAQAGAMDPARAAVESNPLSTAGKSDQSLPEFRVRSVRTVAGSCEK